MNDINIDSEELKGLFNTKIWKVKYRKIKYLELSFSIISIFFLILSIITLPQDFLPPYEYTTSVIIVWIVVLISWSIFTIIDLSNPIPFLNRIHKIPLLKRISKRKTYDDVMKNILKDIYSTDKKIFEYLIIVILCLILASIFKIFFEKNSLTFMSIAGIWIFLMEIPFSIRCRSAPVRARILEVHLKQLISIFEINNPSTRKESHVIDFNPYKIQDLSRLLNFIGADLSIIANYYLALNIKNIRRIPVNIYVAMLFLEDIRDPIRKELEKAIDFLKEAYYSDDNTEYHKLINKTKNGFSHIIAAYRKSTMYLHRSYKDTINFFMHQTLLKKFYEHGNLEILSVIIGIASTIFSFLKF